MMKEALMVNRIIAIREIEGESFERCIEHYKKRNVTIYLVNTNEIINPKQKTRNSKRVFKSKSKS